MRRFYLEKKNFNHPSADITGSDAKHIISVLRMTKGMTIHLFDGKGLEYEAKITDLTRDKVTTAIISSKKSTSESGLQITIAQAYLKNKRMDVLVRQITELGIAEWIPFVSKYSVPRPDDKRAFERIKRWKKIARESLKQCGRSKLMNIHDITSFQEIIKLNQPYDLKVIFWEKETSPLENTSCFPLNRMMVCLGPEGGFTDREIEYARAAGFVTASLGPRILKADTATIAVGSIVQYLFGDIGKPVPERI